MIHLLSVVVSVSVYLFFFRTFICLIFFRTLQYYLSLFYNIHPSGQPKTCMMVYPLIQFSKLVICYLKLDTDMNGSQMDLGIYKQHCGIDLFFSLPSAVSLIFSWFRSPSTFPSTLARALFAPFYFTIP